MRRIQRIVPPLLFMIASVIIFSFLLLYKNEHMQVGKEALSSLFSVANIYLWTLTRNYWGPQPEHSYFLHTWSLSLEEQFYFFFPIILIFILKKAPSLLLTFSFLITFLVYLVFALFASDHPNASFYLLPARCWELGMGATLAIYKTRPNNLFDKLNLRIISLSSWVGISMIFLSYLLLDGKSGLGFGLILPTLGATIFILFAQNPTIGAAKFLSIAPLVFIGKISYSLYLWHWPLLQFSKISDSLSVKGALFNTFIISCFSYFFIEKTTRHNPKALPWIFFGFVTCSIGAIYLVQNKSFYDVSSFEKTIWSGHRYDVTPVQKEADEAMKMRMYGIELVPRPTYDDNALVEGGIRTNNLENERFRILVMGNSHALMWSAVIDDIAEELQIESRFLGMDAVFPFIRNFSSNDTNQETTLSLYDKQRTRSILQGDCLVILAVRWSWSWRHYEYARNMIQFIEAQGSRTILIEQPPELFFGDKNAPQYLIFLGYEGSIEKETFINSGNIAEYEKGRTAMNKLAAEFESCSLIETKDLFMRKDGKVKVMDGKKILFIDDDHLSYEGSKLAKERIMRGIKESMQFFHE